MDQVVGRVHYVTDFLEHDATLERHLILGESRVDDHVTEDVESEILMMLEHLNVDANLFLRRKGVD